MGEFKIISVTLAPTQVDKYKSVYSVYYNMTLSNTFTVGTLHVTAKDELDAYYKAGWEIEKLIDEKEKRDV